MSVFEGLETRLSRALVLGVLLTVLAFLLAPALTRGLRMPIQILLLAPWLSVLVLLWRALERRSMHWILALAGLLLLALAAVL